MSTETGVGGGKGEGNGRFPSPSSVTFPVVREASHSLLTLFFSLKNASKTACHRLPKVFVYNAGRGSERKVRAREAGRRRARARK